MKEMEKKNASIVKCDKNWCDGNGEKGMGLNPIRN